MHAGLARNSRDQRAHAAKFPAITVETIMPAEKRHEKCTPARRVTAAVSGQKVANSLPSPSRRPCRRGNRMKNARRLGAQRLRTAGTRSQIPRRHRQDDHTGGEME
ncbi:hypothetical protein [Bianquea renquensis]|uniref:Uncharacterized protein n=1 Tax=Bianquea renquensis TaxID=2763661 RepID=A0A926DUN1_9FIRM|nr:hypothetical protein [Bianquea renquensis]MBC8544406.1 hypothetical protein [Bianquea renquensis]